MISPQLENGYLRIANELLEEIIRYQFTKREYKIVLAIIRKTYGFQKKNDDISLSQIALMTMIDVANVSRTINDLTDKKILLKRQGQTAQNIELNKKYNEWKVLPKQQLPKQQGKGCQNSKSTIAKIATTKDISKNNIKTNSLTANRFDDFYSIYPKKRKRKDALNIWKRKRLDQKADIIITDVKLRIKKDDRWLKGFIPDPTTYLNGERWDDE